MIIEDTAFYFIEAKFSHFSRAFFFFNYAEVKAHKIRTSRKKWRDKFRTYRRKNIARDNDITGTSRRGLNFVAALELIDGEILWRS